MNNSFAVFFDRSEAGKLLAEKLISYRGTNSIVLAIPRGGVPVGFEVAKLLELPLDIALAKKIGHPGNSEFAIGAVSSVGVILDEGHGVSERYLHDEVERLQALLRQREIQLRGKRSVPDLKNKNLILVDDGIATGYTLMATIQMLRKHDPAKIIVAVPVAPLDGYSKIQQAADEFICLRTPEDFPGVGAFYENFEQVEDEEVKALLARKWE